MPKKLKESLLDLSFFDRALRFGKDILNAHFMGIADTSILCLILFYRALISQGIRLFFPSMSPKRSTSS